MFVISVTLFAALLLLAIGQSIYVFLFSNRIARPDDPLLDDEDCPVAAVVLCVRGKDPHLEKCLTSICDLDYPEYQLHIVLDNEQDPAMPLAQQFCNNNPLGQVHVLDDRRSTCSLKCSSLLYASKQIGDTVSFVAQLDSDTIPNRHWLRALATGLNDPKVGVISGIRWYVPPDEGWGSLVRYIWNAAAIVQMVLYGIAWGGTLAIRKSVFEQTDLQERWGKALCEDTMLSTVLRATEFKTEFRSDLFVVNRESSSLKDVISWISRQLLTARLYHPCWWLVFIHAMSTSIAVLSAVAMLLTSLCQFNFWPAIWLAAGIVLYQVSNAIMLEKIGQTVNRSKTDLESAKPELSVRFLLAAPLTQACYFIAAIAAIFTRTIRWRNIEYEIRGPWSITMKNYEPFSDSANANELESL